MRTILSALFILCSYFVSAQLSTIKCGKLIDGKNELPLLNKAILIEGNQTCLLSGRSLPDQGLSLSFPVI